MPSAELLYRPPNEALLRQIAERTGGLYDPVPEQAVAPPSATAARPLRLWPGLAAAALLLYLANMLLRRVRLFGRAALRRVASGDLAPTRAS